MDPVEFQKLLMAKVHRYRKNLAKGDGKHPYQT